MFFAFSKGSLAQNNETKENSQVCPIFKQDVDKTQSKSEKTLHAFTVYEALGSLIQFKYFITHGRCTERFLQVFCVVELYTILWRFSSYHPISHHSYKRRMSNWKGKSRLIQTLIPVGSWDFLFTEAFGRLSTCMCLWCSLQGCDISARAKGRHKIAIQS